MSDETHAIDYLGTMYFVGPRDKPLDWMAYSFQAPGDPTWRFSYRFRYHAEGKGNPHDGRDRKNTWHGVANEDGRPGIEDALREIAGEMAAMLGCKVEVFEVNGGMDHLMKMPNKPEWMHIKTVPIS